ncbi:MAG: hypothetical protein ACPL4E_10395, partial [Thermoproteota archaeon]
DSQALDVVNTLARNVEWLKTLTGSSRVEVVRKITEYVEKGETCEEAIERAKKESEEFVKNFELEIIDFYNSISNAQLANEVLDLLRHIKDTPGLGPDAAKWLLDTLKGVYLKVFVSYGSREAAEAELRRAVEERFRYPESRGMNCVLASAIVKELMEGERSFEFKEPRRVMLRKGRQSHLNLGESNKVKLGTYAVRVHWEHDGKSGVMEFSIVKNVESERIEVPKEQVDQVLEEIGKDEVQVLITKVELFDYRLLFPTVFFVGDKRMRIDLFNNEMEINGMCYKFSTNPDVHEGRIRIDAEFEGKNMDGKNLVLSFYQDGEIRIKYGRDTYLIKTIEMDATGSLIRVEYLKGWEVMAEYCFNLKPLSEQMGKIPCEINMEGQQKALLKERLFRLLGYDALKELEERITADEDRRVILLICFDNGKRAYCGSKELRVHIPQGVKSITTIEIVAYKELMSLKQLAADILADPRSTERKGRLGEAIINEKFMNGLIEEASKRSGVPREKIKVEWQGENIPGKEVPDFVMKNAETDEKIAIVEAKYVSNPENVKDFGERIEEAKEDVNRYLNSEEWAADYGAIVVISWSPEDILGDIPYPAKVGEFNNPHIEWVSRGGS